MADYGRVVIESGKKKVFASAIDWPGWSHGGKSEDDALQVLADYAGRYQAIAEIAGVDGVADAAAGFEVVERQVGSGQTDYGVPGFPAECETAATGEAECERQIMLLEACWSYFDGVVPRVSAELRKGPRGGGRDRDEIVEHTLGADRGYARRIGVKTPDSVIETPEGLRSHRDVVIQAIRELSASGEQVGSWPVRYFIRRAGWHLLDHAWEMEDTDLS